MEEKGGLLLKRSRGGPTRLQKHAPASLDIDMVINDRPSNPFDYSSKAIPLLSPLILSPKPLYADITIQALQSQNNDSNDIINEGSGSSSSTPGSAGWEHPAIASFPDPSSLSSFFQNQCVFVNHAQ
ncbi:uncharacterized protein [Cicer arietinum]|uniref:Uncharacterized protein LOC101503242 n=1 Tax=Cicer arietinum TaxID=3827 RepID=A0A1S2XFM5_CICAR|nr:uncharacterized protein LOC101503242 [Cicer arietinum]